MADDWYIRTEKIGNAVLYLADCKDVFEHIGTVDAMVTDPPYGVELSKLTYTDREATTKYEDTREHILSAIIPRVLLAIEKADCSILTPGTNMMFDYPRPDEVGCVYHPAGVGMSSWGFRVYHPIYFYGKDPYLSCGKGSYPSGTVATKWTSQKNIDHPCPKPVMWMEWMVKRATTTPGAIVLDPFMGSGTTGVACMNLGRKFIGIEVEPKYFDIACERIAAAHNTPSLFDAQEVEPELPMLALDGDDGK